MYRLRSFCYSYFAIFFFISLASEGKYKCVHGLKLEQHFYDLLFA